MISAVDCYCAPRLATNWQSMNHLQGLQPVHYRKHISLPAPLGQEAQTVRAPDRRSMHSAQKNILRRAANNFHYIEFSPLGGGRDTVPYKRPPLINIAYYRTVREHGIHALAGHACSKPLHLIPASCSNRPST